jgi:hypothetical protein
MIYSGYKVSLLYYPKDGGSISLQNVDNNIPDNMAFRSQKTVIFFCAVRCTAIDYIWFLSAVSKHQE